MDAPDTKLESDTLTVDDSFPKAARRPRVAVTSLTQNIEHYRFFLLILDTPKTMIIAYLKCPLN